MKSKIQFAPDDKVDEGAYELVEVVFGIKGALLTNESTLEDFDDNFEILGHELVPLRKVPREKRSLYLKGKPEFAKTDRYSVWFPPLTEEEREVISNARRTSLLRLVEQFYGISLRGYPKKEPLYVWRVTEFIRRKN